MFRWLKKIGAAVFVAFCLVLLVGLASDADDGRKPTPAQPSGQWSSIEPVAENVDALIAQTWSANGVAPLGLADEHTLLRRLSLALHGTIPSLAEIRDFESLGGEDRLQRWIDRLLADERFGYYYAERLSRAIVSPIPVFITYRRRRFVSWLSEQITADRPYDEVVREIIASEGVWTDTPATNFVSGYEFDANRLTTKTARAFLGIRLDCAECHDHPFADWTQDDYRGLAAFYGQCEIGFAGVSDNSDNDYRVEDPETKEEQVFDPKVPFAEELARTQGRRRERLAEWVTHQNNPYFARAIVNRVWRLLMGAGLIEPVDDLESDERIAGVLDVIADDFRENGRSLQRLIRVITATEAFRRTSAVDAEVSELQEELLAAYPISRLRPEQVAAAIVQMGSLRTMDSDRNLLVRLVSYGNMNDFIAVYGDAGEEELSAREGNISQRLQAMNGKMTQERVKFSPFNAAGRISMLAPSDDRCVETAFLVCLTRRPTEQEATFFIDRLAGIEGDDRNHAVEDMMWALVNCTEFSWNH